MERFDVAIIGGGVLGTSFAYWLASRYDGTIAVFERERNVARHTSARNTGVIHRPFYLHPEERKVFARASQTSYSLWRAYAAERGLPWQAVGTLKAAMENEEIKTLEKNAKWAVQNGMDPSEVEVLEGKDVAKIEPNVRCAAALHAKTDTVVDYRVLTEAVRQDAEALGARFLVNAPVATAKADDYGVTLVSGGVQPDMRASFVINCAGGEAVDIAHALGVGVEYADLHFRGDYWVVDDRIANLVQRNVYVVPRQSDLPFLDPHWIVRVDGSREIGPNAAPVPGSRDYEGLFRHLREWPPKVFEPPMTNKVRLALSREFLGVVVREMFSSLSRGEMMRRVQRFIPKLREEHLVARGVAGVRSNVVNRQGRMEKEALELEGPHSFHILNYNSPGATGAPAYTAYLVDRLARRGAFDHLRPNVKKAAWDWDTVAEAMHLAS
jgi:L-2-hydroxyglutarate oxidase